MSLPAIDPRRLDLAAEFRARPFGRSARSKKAGDDGDFQGYCCTL
jgi:hypothetical protein